MKILVVGNGGREHAIAWKIGQNPKVEKIYCAPGNGGTHLEKKCENINLSNKEDLVNFALENEVDLTIIGPEVYLCDGIVDLFKSHNLKVFGPSKEASILEGSKAYAKEFMKKYDVKTAAYDRFDDAKKAINYIKNNDKYPIVIKADGLAAGKGVIIAKSEDEAIAAIEDIMLNDSFSGAGKEIVIEEFLSGVEASILSITDGKTIIPFISSKDHKAIYNGNEGPNTGGMGTIAPNPYCSEKVLKEFNEKILNPTLKGIKSEGFDFKGIIFFGLMINKSGVYLLEYNVRMGDPETQVVLPLMKTDFLGLIEAALEERLDKETVSFEDKTACCVIAASAGYPLNYSKGKIISGIENCNEKVFVAGAVEENQQIITSGGRVLGVTAIGDSLKDSRERAYKGLKELNFEGIYYRTDIGSC